MRGTDDMSPREPRATVGSDDLSEVALARIADHIALEGPRVVRRARRIRVAVRVTSVGLGLTLVLFGLNRLRPGAEAPMIANNARACERWDFPMSPQLEVGRVELGRRGVVAVAEASELRVAKNERCELVIRMERGEILVHAQDLGGGTLVIETELGRVRVLGTIFEVSHREGAFGVSVVEGLVEVELPTEQRKVEAGHRLVLSDGKLVASALGPDELAERRARLLREPSAMLEPDREVMADEAPPTIVDEPRRKAKPRVRRSVRESPAQDALGERVEIDEAPPMAESADALVARAAQLRAKQPEEAKTLYRRAGSMSGATAEAAWLALARMELAAGNYEEAIEALDQRDRRFPRGGLVVEAAGIRLETYATSGERERARALAEQIIAQWPKSQQAKRAQSLLGETNR